ncbi:Fic family protein [Flammeovirga kamogawensis]|uniref:Fic family protein n=1 Tax=Flammeovirga kamogawensis TaxID=373891 RepID=A0ABX8GYK2_9BACT|nr:Fic/DOC family N-terminal domain-containing protein [Flammeovirga kamogawensis]MBB6460934.1 Fic family protein [Flammeovirga kamogawensis]QWG08277.1 Fic family protein [Flammeovirga kamogawensis]TRX70078.1 Fic family protein [Flammeovirga kamogawensis]
MWELEHLPYKELELESKKVLKALPRAHFALAELKGVASSIPNQEILINTLALQEAKDSSEIENIITTHDDLYKSSLDLENLSSLGAKEVQNYISALKKGYYKVQNEDLLTNKSILAIQEELEKNNAGFRSVSGTSLKNAKTGEVIYTPPQNKYEIEDLMSNLEKYINIPELEDLDPIIKMALIHFQFESIHSFYDGNGRTGRIINILYLILAGLQDLPILYLSNYIIKNKQEYYQLLQGIRDEGAWEQWLLFMIKGVEETSRDTIALIHEMKELMMRFKYQLRENYKFYSQDLLNNLFKHPYTKIDFLMEELSISRVTASNYLNRLATDGLLSKQKMGNQVFFINYSLFKLLTAR